MAVSDKPRKEVMEYIIGNIVNCLHDDNQFYQILEVNFQEGFVRVKQLSTNTEFKITIQKEEVKE